MAEKNTMNLNGIDINLDELLSEVRHDMATKVFDSVKQSISWQVEQEIRNHVKTIVSQYMQDEINPEIQALLVGSKSEILNAVRVALVPAGEAVAKLITDKLTNNLSQSYKSERILKALLD